MWSAGAQAQGGCVPNPNAAGPPFVNGCDIPASGLNAAVNLPCVLITSEGGVGDGTTDNSQAFIGSLNAGGANPCVRFPAGTFLFKSAVSYTLTNRIESVTVLGMGADQTIIKRSGSGDLWTFNESSQFQSVHIRDMSCTTNQMPGGTCWSIIQNKKTIPDPAVTAQSDFTNVSIYSGNGYNQNQYWAKGIQLTNVSNVAFYNPNIVGGATAGIGVSIDSASATPGVSFNFYNPTFTALASGINYGDYVQGVAVHGGNCTGTNRCVNVAAGLHASIDQLTVVGMQANPLIAFVDEESTLCDTILVGNYVILPTTAFGVVLHNACGNEIVANNTFRDIGGLHNTVGVRIDANAGTAKPAITGNTFLGLMQYGVQSTASGGTFVQAGNSFDSQLTAPFNVTTSGVYSNGIIAPIPTVVGSLPTCNATTKYQVYAVSDANSPTYGATLTGGSSTLALAFCDGSNWKAH
jgi:hypothetical protein